MITGAKQRLFFAAQSNHLHREDSNDIGEIKQSKSNSAFSSNSLSNLKKNLSIDNMVDRLSKAHKTKPLKKHPPSSHSNCEDFSLCNDHPEVLRPRLLMQSQQAPLRDKFATASRKGALATKTSPVKALKYSSKQTKSSCPVTRGSPAGAQDRRQQNRRLLQAAAAPQQQPPA